MDCNVIRTDRIDRRLRRLMPAALGLLLAGCSAGSHARQGTLLGTGVGTAAGAIIGHQSGHGAEGALAGAVAGAVTGGVAGHVMDEREEQEAAVRQAAWEQSSRLLTNDDLIQMAAAGLSDEVIINAVRTRGGRFDVSPNGLIALKASGVSDRVLSAVQSAAVPATSHYAADEGGAVVQGVVVVHPRPPVRVAVPRVRVAPLRRRVHGRRFWW